MKCPHCGKEIKQIGVVRHWRTHLVTLPEKRVQVESIGYMPAIQKPYYRPTDRPVLVVVSEVKDEN